MNPNLPYPAIGSYFQRHCYRDPACCSPHPLEDLPQPVLVSDLFADSTVQCIILVVATSQITRYKFSHGRSRPYFYSCMNLKVKGWLLNILYILTLNEACIDYGGMYV